MSKGKRPSRTGILLLLLAVLVLLTLYAEKWLKAVLHYLSNAPWARRFVSDFPPAWSVASRFVAGETIAEAMQVAQELNEKGMVATLAYLGEGITDPDEACRARDEILNLLQSINETGVEAGISVKLSHLGVKIDPDLALENMRLILERAQQHGLFVRIDMEESALVDTTLKLYRSLRDNFGFDNTGVVIQSYLYRSEADVRRLASEGASVRLCKGAYNEPPQIAFPKKQDTNDNFVHLMKLLLAQEARNNGTYAALATHDEQMIQATIDFIAENDVPQSDYEFQMLYGIRRRLQETLIRNGHDLRIYVPYGTAWYPYFMRRLAERPANLWFFLNSLLRG